MTADRDSAGRRGSPTAAKAAERAGLGSAEVADWLRAAPPGGGSFERAASTVAGFLGRGEALLARLPQPGERTETEHDAASAISEGLTAARDEFLRGHVDDLYGRLTRGLSRSLRVEELLDAAAELVPGLVPDRAQMELERRRRLPDKLGLELAQGQVVAHVLGRPRSGEHLINAMLKPTADALDLLDQFRSRREVDLGAAHVRRQGRAAFVELRNPRHLNAEDGSTLGPTEAAVDLVLLDPAVDIAVFRGGVVSHAGYAGRRVFGSGINLTHLYQGRIDYLFYLIRDLGYVNKIYRGLEQGEKLWIAAVEQFAIGGACQLLHVVDHVVAARGSRLYLPARNEGIIPGASNLRLPRFVGDRAARQAILSGRQWTAGEPDADLLCDEIVEPGDIDRSIASRIEALTSSGVVNAAANRRALRAGQEPIGLFREYMATYAHEQARCHLSPALVANLEQHWRAAERSVKPESAAS